LSKKGELPNKAIVPAIACFSRNEKRVVSIFYTGRRRICRMIPVIGNQPIPARFTCIVNDVEQSVMKTLPSFGRNDVIRAVALVSVVAFPLIADAQLGTGSRATKLSKDVSPVAVATSKATPADPDSCADQHWPFFSKGCLRGSTGAIEPRLVSMNAESPPISATADGSAKAAGATDAAQGNAPFARSKQPAKPRVATHRRERSNTSVNYAVNSEIGHMSPAGW
jgi:hypothetical protein